MTNVAQPIAPAVAPSAAPAAPAAAAQAAAAPTPAAAVAGAVPAPKPAVAAAAKKPRVMVMPIEGQDSPIVPFSNPEFGYIKLRVEKLKLGRNWGGREVRTLNYRAEVGVLEDFLSQEMDRNGTIPGILIQLEFAYNDTFKDPNNVATAEYLKRLQQDIADEDERIEPYIKRAGDGGPILRDENGDPIIWFTDYIMEPTAADVDVRVQYANLEEVREYQQLQKAEKNG